MSRYSGETDIVAILQRRMDDIQRETDKIKHEGGLFPEPWRNIGATGNPAFSSGWGNYGSGHTVGSFRKEDNGIIRLKGMVTGTPAGTIFTLPVGYRPATRLLFAIFQNDGAGRIDIFNTGVVSGFVTGWISLDNINFVIES